MNIDDDVLRAAKELARLSGRTLGEVLSDLARESLTTGIEDVPTRNGVPILEATPDAGLVTSEDVSRLLDED